MPSFQRHAIVILRSQPRIILAWTGTLLLVLLLSTSGRAAPPSPLPPHLVPGDGAIGPAAGDQTTPVIAAGAGGYLAVWTDDRTAFPAGGGDAGSGRDIYAVRLDSSGAPLDPVPFVVNQGPGDQDDPLVCWNGTDWLVLWTGSEPYLQYSTPLVEAARVSPDGEVLDPDPILIWDGGTTYGPSSDHVLGVTSNGTDWAVVMVDEYVSGLATRLRLAGLRVTPDGSVLNAPYYLYSPSCCSFFYKGGVAYVDGVYMAVFEGYFDSWTYGIYGLRLSETMTTLDSYPLEMLTVDMQNETHYYRRPGITAGNGTFYVTWQLYISGTSSQVYGARVASSGVSLDGDGVPISGVLPLSLELSCEPVWDGTQWIVGWPDGTQQLARVGSDGTVLDPGGVDTGLEPGAFASAGSGGVQFTFERVAGVDPTPFDVFHAGIDAGLAPDTETCLGLGAPTQHKPQLAVGGDGNLLVFLSSTSEGTRVLAHVLDAGGEAILPEPVELAAGEVGRPRAAFDGTDFLAVWEDGSTGEIHGRRLSPAGAVLDGSDLVLLDGTDPDVAGTADQWLVTASRPGGVAATRVDGGGGVLDDPALSLYAGGNVGPRTVDLAGNYLVVWEATGQTDGSEIQLNLVVPAGPTTGVFDLTGQGDGLSHHRPAVAGGDPALIVWEDDRGGDVDLYGARLGGSLLFLDPAAGFEVVAAPGNQRAAAAAWDGSQFLVDFADDRNATSGIDKRLDVLRGWVEDTGVVPEPAGLDLLSPAVPVVDPTVAGSAGNSLYAAAEYMDQEPYAAYRLAVVRAALPSAVGDGTGEGATPRASGLLAIYPNPANPRVTIRYALARSGPIRVEIHDLTGARIRTLATGTRPAGENLLTWDGRDDEGRTAPSGTYLFRVSGGGVELTGKVALVR